MGTFEELCEMITWAQLGLHHKRIIVFDVGGFYEPPPIRQVDAAFLRPEHRELAARATTVEDVMALLATPPPEIRPKWIDRDQT
jgi:predicted Rossmann-fold nucleotide-binding protein